MDFLSVGNSSDVGTDRLDIGRTIQTLATGTEVIRLIDRDLRSPAEVAQLKAYGTRVLGRRHIEAYLLDDEVIAALCVSVGQKDKISDATRLMQEALAGSVSRGNDSDDYKSAGGTFYTQVRRLLTLTAAGSNWDAFARDTLAPLLRPGLKCYDELRMDIFGR